MTMQTSIASSVVATVEGCPAWLKGTAQATFAFILVKGVAWLAVAWLAFRGF
jgi:hypothetical protein